jgi:hypothetical protein
MPGADARAALEGSVVQMGADMDHQHVAHTMWSYETLGLTPGADA